MLTELTAHVNVLDHLLKIVAFGFSFLNLKKKEKKKKKKKKKKKNKNVPFNTFKKKKQAN